ncbi:MAG: transcriptional regulator [Erysipelotrichaceae bacterium]|nr:transcriptional regulator [Erysipelotrichaceae bacterium]MBQ9987977.1 cyclic-di-AMP receptor [Erysipelotrichales bacterium]MBR3693805.1 cyclic-di-AMP receptor [Erysipelotrichales bacterium]
MKLILAIVSDDDCTEVSSSLTKNKFSVTRLATTGGFLKSGNSTLICGVDDEHVDTVISIISANSRKRTQIVPSSSSFDLGRYGSYPIEVTVGGATIFVLDVEQFIKV